MNHICTTESFIVDDIPMFEKFCPVCCKKTKQRATWVSVLCLECRGEHGPDYTFGMIASQRRRLILGLTRRELGMRLGIRTSSVARYERDPCPMSYFQRLEKLVKEKRTV